jgi:putative inorganic carbon (hco3(-)) transporter
MTLAFLNTEVVASSSIAGKALLLYGVVVFSVVASLLWKSEIGLYLLAFLLPLQTTRYHLHGLPFGGNVVDILLLSCLVGAVLRPQTPLARNPKVLGFLGFMAVFYYLSLWRGAFFLGGILPLWINDPRLVDYKNIMVMPMLTVAAIVTLRTRKQFAIILLLCCAASAIVDYSYFKSAAGRDFTHYSEDTRDAGPLGYAGENGLASYQVEITLCLLPLLMVPRRPMIKMALALLLVANIWCLLFSYSREAYLALAVGLLLLAVVRMRWLLIPLLLLGFTWEALLPDAVQERIGMTYSQEDEGHAAKLDSSAQERVSLWTDAMTMVHENPVLGSGFLTYSYMNRVGSYRDTHNFYLKMMVETGIPGLILFIVLLFLFFREGYVLFRNASDPFLSLLGLGFAALMLGAIIVNFFGDRWLFIQVDSNLWILLGCVICASSLSRSEEIAAASPASEVAPEEVFDESSFWTPAPAHETVETTY